MEDTLIIGGGVIGVCAAYYLAERGAPVTLVEQGEVAAGSSYGNAGLIVPSHVVPLAEPGALASGLKWMLDPESPFYIKPRLDLDLISWLLRFAAAAREGPMRRAIPVMRDLGCASSALYNELAALDGLNCYYEQNGMLLLYNTQHGLERGAAEARLLNEFDVPAKMLDGAAVRAIAPQVRPEVVGALRFPQDAHFNPADFVRGLARLVERKGARIYAHTEVLGFETAGRKVTTIQTTRGDFRPGQVVLATGSWSPGVARDLRLNVPIQPAKGYSVTVKRPAACPTIPMLLGEARVAVTPMGPTLRFAGTLELAGLDFSINRRRVEALRRAVPEYLTGMEDLETVEIWRGLRPCTPDGLPIIGRAQKFENLIFATGHAMVGMSLGPITGKLVAQVACGEKPEMDLTPLRLERF